MTAFQAFESLFSIFFGTEYPNYVSYLAAVATALVICGLCALLIGIFTRRSGKYIGIVAIVAVVVFSLMFLFDYKYGQITSTGGGTIQWLLF